MAARARRARSDGRPRDARARQHRHNRRLRRRSTADQQVLVLRAFGLYFQLANLAEQHHRLRRRREDAHDGVVAARVARGCVPAAQRCAGRRARPARARATSIRLVLTAHPTEATRRTVLLAHIRIAEQLVRSTTRACRRTSGATIEQRIAEEVTLLWQTDEVRHDRLRVTDEIRHGLWFFEHSLMLRRNRSASVSGADGVPGAPPPISFGSWIGGDMDGNPATGPASIAEALAARARLALRALSRRGARARGRARTGALARPRLGRARGIARPATRSSCPSYAAEIGARNELEPYRRKLSFMWWRLGNDALRAARGSARRPASDPREPRRERRAPGRRRPSRPRWSGWSSCSASTSPSSTCGCTPAISGSQRAGEAVAAAAAARTQARQRCARHADRVRERRAPPT